MNLFYQLQQAIEQLRNERDFYKNEYKNIKDNYNKTIEIDHVKYNFFFYIIIYTVFFYLILIDEP